MAADDHGSEGEAGQESAELVARQVAKQKLPEDGAVTSAGLFFVSIGPGRAAFRLVVAERHLNSQRTCHGGYLFLLADAALSYACNSFGTPTVASGGQIDFLRPALLGDVLDAEATLRTQCHRSAVYDVTVRRGETVIAEFRGRTRTMPHRDS
jgi:acyl-CoA thioesterase